jgi:hypothetical protein
MSEPSPAAHAEKPKVIYVLGAHRSGSTVLGVALGNCAETFFAGELHAWFTKRGVSSFGGGAGERLWQEVGESMPGAEDLFGHETQLFIDRSSALFRIHRWPARRRLLPRYRRLTEELYRAISRAASSRVIVDTSHYPPRARMLQTLPGIELYLLFLVRDPQGIIASFDPNDEASMSKGLLNANAYLWVTYLLSLVTFLRHPRERRMLVRHEDFLADPQATLRQILDMAGSSAPVPNLSALHTGSPLQGNRLLKSSQVIALRPHASAPQRGSWVTAVMQSPWKLILPRLRPASKPAARVRHGAAPDVAGS